MRILFLQGNASPFFVRLARALEEEGHEIYKILFCGGDRLFWGNVGTVFHYTQSVDDVGAYYESFVKEHGIDAAVLFSDCRPLHVPLVDLFKTLEKPVFVCDEGYLRPNWITLEEGGTNANSREFGVQDVLMGLDGDMVPVDYPNGAPVVNNFWTRAGMDIAYHLGNVFMAPFYPRYRCHRPHLSFVEYAGFVVRFFRRQFRRRVHTDRMKAFRRGRKSFFLLPLQLDSDFQIRTHSPYAHMEHVMDDVMASFAAHALPEDHLVIKLHPLDNGLRDYEAVCNQLAAKHGLTDRVWFFEKAHMPLLLRRCKGVVVVNSTVGISALIHTQPVKVLGAALYDKPGMTYQGRLQDFWLDPSQPDRALVTTFRNRLIDETQVNGGFFSSVAVAMAVRGAKDRIDEIMAVEEPVAKDGRVKFSGPVTASKKVA